MKSTVIVDNTAPVIQSLIIDGQTYRGSFEIDARIEDEYAGVDQVSVKLDETEIELPYATSSGQLAGGTHHLSITATDKAGNQAAKQIAFELKCRRRIRWSRSL